MNFWIRTHCLYSCLLQGGGGGGNNLMLQQNGGGYGNSGNYGLGPELQCCDEVVDPLSLLATIGGIAALSLFLRWEKSG